MIPTRALHRVLFGGALVVGAYLLRDRVGAVRDALRIQPDVPTDSALVDKIAAEVLRGIPKGRVDVNAEDRVIVLRGELEETDQIIELEEKIRDLDGVVDVENRLRLSDGRPDIGALSETS